MELLQRLSQSGLRKFIVAMFAISCATGLCAFSRIDGGAFATIVLGIAGLFMAGNVAAKISGANPQVKPGEEVNDQG